MENQEKVDTTKQVGNPTGKGGFGDHPEHRSDGRWDKNNSFSYWLNYFKTLTIQQFKDYKDEHEHDMTMSCLAAYARVSNMIKDLNEFNVVADRTEGRVPQGITMGVDDTIGEIEVKLKLTKDEKSEPGSDQGIPKKL